MCEGTDDNDRINGTNSDEHIFGYGGSDTINGNGGSEHVVGDGQLNTALDGNDKLDGGAAADRVYGYGGSDTLIGGAGADYIDAVSGETSGASNTIRAGSENDEISADNGVQDTIDCGTGCDSVLVGLGGFDRVAKNCESVSSPTPPPSP